MGELPRTTADIGADWLNDVLSDDVRGHSKVTAVDSAIIGEGVGFLGEVARLTLTYDAPSATSTRTMISKLPTANEGFKHVGLMLGLYEKESGFYRDVAPEIDIRIPHAYCNLADGDGNFVLLLEDLAPMRPGDQLASCSLAEAHLALDAVAALHARWWEHPRLDEFATWLPDDDSPYIAVLEGAYQQSAPAFHENWSHMVADEVNALVDRVGADYRRSIAAGAWRRPHTFIHGDYRLDNMMFGGAGQEPFGLLDFQLPFRANPLWDVVYFLAGNFDPAWRRDNQEALLARYHAALVANGVDDFSLEQCWENYRAAALVLIGYIVTSAGDVDLTTLDERGHLLISTMFERYGTAIIDLESADFLDA